MALATSVYKIFSKCSQSVSLALHSIRFTCSSFYNRSFSFFPPSSFCYSFPFPLLQLLPLQECFPLQQCLTGHQFMSCNTGKADEVQPLNCSDHAHEEVYETVDKNFDVNDRLRDVEKKSFRAFFQLFC